MATSIFDTRLQEFSRARGSVSQHALLGTVAFSLVTYFEGMEAKYAADYAEHALLEGKPALQWTGDKLDELSWDIVLHSGYCDPETEMLKLRQAVRDHKALPLVFANGDYRGYFVPTEATITSKHHTSTGSAIWIEAKLSLREFYKAAELVERKQAQAAETSTSAGTKKPARTKRRTPVARTSDRPTRGGQ